MNSDLFLGKLVRLSAEEPEEFGKAFSRWMRDSEYIRLLDTQTAALLSEKKVTEWFKPEELKMMDDILFSVRNLTEEQKKRLFDQVKSLWILSDLSCARIPEPR